MATNFVLTLDTTAPTGSLQLNGGAAYTGNPAFGANPHSDDPDVAQMKIWGDIDNTYDANIQDTEAATSWIGYAGVRGIKVTAGDGLKTVRVRFRDDVGNQSPVYTATITLDTVAPVPNITIPAAPTKISKVAGFDTSNFTFVSDSDIQAWMVRVVPAVNSLNYQGQQIPVQGGSTNVNGGAKAAGVGVAVGVKGADLETASAGDGDKFVKVFVQDLTGIWST